MPIYYCDGERLKRGIYAGTSWLNQNRKFVDSLNVFPIPDGDTGTNMALTLSKVTESLDKMNTNHLPAVASQIAESSLWGARGCSGVILSQILCGLAEGISDKPRIDSTDIALSLRISANKAYSAIEKPAEGTILTLLREVAESTVTFADKEKDIANLLKHILEIGEETLIRTKDLLPELKKANVIDAGGKGFLIIIEGILKLILGEDFQTTIKSELPNPTIQKKELEEKYCLDFVLRGEVIPNFKKHIETFGKDIITAGAQNILKVHMHTNNPDNILQIARTYGIVEEIKIDDMQRQHFEFTSFNNKIGVIVVAPGEGMQKIFKNLNADIVIEGGQTMNPSVEELLIAIQRLPAEKIFLLPNNTNIIASARQAAEISGKEVSIIPTKTIPEGITAITSFSQEKSSEENIKRMNNSISDIKSGEITQAVRDSEFGTLKIKAGDYIGIYNHSIVASNKERDIILIELLSSMVAENDSVISVFYGDKGENVDELFRKISTAFPGPDVEVHYGGQPHYDYIVGVE